MKKMGMFSIKFEVSGASGEKSRELDGIVDTGAALPLIPEAVLKELNVSPKRYELFVLADGSTRRLPIGEARLSYGGVNAPCLVAFAPPDCPTLFGALALEVLGFDVDAVNRRLTRTQRYLLAVA